MDVAPVNDRHDDGVEVEALLRQPVFVAQGPLLVGHLGEDEIVDQRSSRLVRMGRVTPSRVWKSSASDAQEAVAQDQQGPAVADDRHGPCQRTCLVLEVGVPIAWRFRRSRILTLSFGDNAF